MEVLWTIVTWMVFGLVVGLIARALYPGPQPMGFLGTMVLGIVGSLVGGFIAWIFGFRPADGPFSGAGWIMSLIGALIVVFLGLFASNRMGGAARTP